MPSSRPETTPAALTMVAGAPKEVVLESLLRCPHCGHEKLETMATDACQFFYQCSGCGKVLRPNPGDCCVFCSFGTVKCPPVQARRGCCG